MEGKVGFYPTNDSKNEKKKKTKKRLKKKEGITVLQSPESTSNVGLKEKSLQETLHGDTIAEINLKKNSGIPVVYGQIPQNAPKHANKRKGPSRKKFNFNCSDHSLNQNDELSITGDCFTTLQESFKDIKREHIPDLSPVKNSLLRKSDSAKCEIVPHLADLKNHFTVAKWWILILDFNDIIILRKVHQKSPEAQFLCNKCSYYCNDLDVVSNHIEEERHRTKIETSLLISTCTLMPRLTHAIYDMIRVCLINNALTYSMKPYHVKLRQQFVKSLNKTVSEKLLGCSLRIFGSSLHGMGLQSSDLNIDLVVDSNTHGPTALSQVADIILQEIPLCKMVTKHFSADVDTPHVKFFVEMGKGMDVECVISLNNEKPFKLSTLLQKYASMDIRVPLFCSLFRLWGKMCNIDQQGEGTWPSYAFYLLGIFYLQQVNVLPVLHDFVAKKNLETPENYADPSEISGRWSQSSQSHIGMLWCGVFRFYAVDFNAAQRVVSIQHSAPFSRSQKSWGGKRIAVVDPFLPKRNVTRSVCHDRTYEYILYCFRTTFLYFGTPQTSEGPIFGYIKHGLKADDLGLGEIQNYIKHQKMLHSLIPKLIIGADKNYKNAQNYNIVEIFKHLTEGGIFNMTKLDLFKLKDIAENGRKPEHNMYKNFTVFESDAFELISQIKPEVLVYEFNYEHFTSDKVVPLNCAVCQREGHTKANCPEEILPDLEPLPPLSKETVEYLDRLCETVYDKSIPSPSEHLVRLQIVEELENIIVSLYPDAKLTLFGSSCNGFGLKGSDLDICLTFSDNANGKDLDAPSFIEILYTDLIKQSRFQKLICIPSAKVPIIKFCHKPTMLEGDISLYNTLAIENTKLLWTYSQIDKRVTALGYMIKKFAKLCNIGDASKGSLSSYSYTLMAIFFLQQCKPPVIPVLQELTDNPSESTHTNIIEGCNTYFYSNLNSISSVWPHLGENTKSVGELWLELLRYYTEDFDLVNYVISIRSSKPISKFSKLWVSKCIAIEDPFDLNHNLGSALSRKMNVYIIKAFRKGRLHFSLPITHLEGDVLSTSLLRHYFDPKILADVEPPNDRGCHFCKNIGHKSYNCPEKPVKNKKGKNKGVRHSKEKPQPKDICEISETISSFLKMSSSSSQSSPNSNHNQEYLQVEEEIKRQSWSRILEMLHRSVSSSQCFTNSVHPSLGPKLTHDKTFQN